MLVIESAEETMTEHQDPAELVADDAYRIWSVSEFSARYGVAEQEQRRLLELFGPFATTCELLNNARRWPRWR